MKRSSSFLSFFFLFHQLKAEDTTTTSLDSSEVEFVTRFVNDAKAHLSEYVAYIETGTASVPSGLTSLAKQVQTYTDDSYTSLFDDGAINVSQLETFAEALPWYSQRIIAGASGAGGETSETETSGNDEATSTSASDETTSVTQAGTSSSGSSIASGPSIVPPGTTSTVHHTNGAAGGSDGHFPNSPFAVPIAAMVALLL